MARKTDFFDDPSTLWIRVVILWMSATFGSPFVVVAAGWPAWIGVTISALFGIGIPILFFFAWRAKKNDRSSLDQ